MSLATARWFVLVTGVLALAGVCVAVVMGLRVHRLRAELMDLRHEDRCPPQMAREVS